MGRALANHSPRFLSSRARRLHEKRHAHWRRDAQFRVGVVPHHGGDGVHARRKLDLALGKRRRAHVHELRLTQDERVLTRMESKRVATVT